MIRFAALTPSLAQPGGAERTILIQVRYADPARMQCTGVAVSGFGGVDEPLARELLHYVSLHGDMPRGKWARPRGAGLVKTTYRHLRDAIAHVCVGADALVTWGSLAMGQYTDGLRIPVVCVSHCSDTSHTRITGITHLVAVSENARRFFAEVPDAGRLPVHVIPNGVEVDRVCPRRGRAWQREAWGVAAGERVLLYLGRQATGKNPVAAVQALAHLPPDHRLVMIGNQAHLPHEPMPRLVEVAAELGVADRVKFLPPIAHVGDALAGADCLVHLSLREADSLVIKEAFLAGLPVVYTPTGATPEMEAEFGVVGWRVDFDTVEGKPVVDPWRAAWQVGRALSDDAVAVAAKMRAVAWERWTGPAMCERWADYLERIVAEWTPP